MSVNVEAKLSNIEKHLAIIMMANGFLSMGLDVKSLEDLKVKDDDIDTMKQIKRLTLFLGKISRIYQGKLSKVASISDGIFRTIEKQAHREAFVSTNRFKSKLRLDDKKQLVADGILMGLALLLEYQSFNNRYFNVDFKAVNSIYQTQLKDDKFFKNSLILASRFADKIKDL